MEDEDGQQVPINWLVLDSARSPKHLKTLAEWGSLPDVLSLAELSALLAEVCDQDEQAILKVLGDEVWSLQVPFFGRVAATGGEWTPSWLRANVRFAEKVRVRKLTSTTQFSGTIAFPEREDLMNDAVGMKPIDALALLRRKGRRVPAELLDILGDPDQHTQPSETVPTPTGGMVPSSVEPKSEAKSFSEVGLDSLHQQHRENKKAALAWADANSSDYGSLNDMASAIIVAGVTVNAPFTTVRKYMTEWNRTAKKFD